MQKNTPVLVGPFPDPIQGVSITVAKLAAIFESHGIAYEKIDTSPGITVRGGIHHFNRFRRTLGGFLKILFAPPRRSYEMAVDGGAGLIYNIIFALALRFRGAPTVLHHHSTRYVIADSSLMRILLGIMGPGTMHLMCSRKMFDAFRTRYCVADRVIVVSNAAWIEPIEDIHRAPGNEIKLGFLSYLSADKGTLRALETLRCAKQQSLPVRLIVAGAAGTVEGQTAVKDALGEFGDSLEYLGRISDAEKSDLLRSLDYFLFPSLYEHETQSLVVPEALSAGTPVIAHDHRYVAELLQPHGGFAIPDNLRYADQAVRWIAEDMSAETRKARAAQARRQYKKIRAEAMGQIDVLIAWLLAPQRGRDAQITASKP